MFCAAPAEETNTGETERAREGDIAVAWSGDTRDLDNWAFVLLREKAAGSLSSLDSAAGEGLWHVGFCASALSVRRDLDNREKAESS